MSWRRPGDLRLDPLLPLSLWSFWHAVQHECIPHAILGNDVLCQAKSGMGKTAVFVLSILQQLDPKANECHAIILCHTRELAFQVRSAQGPVSRLPPNNDLPPRRFATSSRASARA